MYGYIKGVFNISPQNESTPFRLPVGDNILEFNNIVHLVVNDVFIDNAVEGDVPVDNEMPVVTLLIPSIFQLNLRRCSYG